MSRTTSYASGSPFSTRVIARARARLSPARTPSASVSRVQCRRPAMGRMLVPYLEPSGFGGVELGLAQRDGPAKARREHDCDEPRKDREAGADSPDPATAERACHWACGGHRGAEDRVGDAHRDRERAAPVRIGNAALDEQDVVQRGGA